jgi:hypothetical protein
LQVSLQDASLTGCRLQVKGNKESWQWPVISGR